MKISTQCFITFKHPEQFLHKTHHRRQYNTKHNTTHGHKLIKLTSARSTWIVAVISFILPVQREAMSTETLTQQNTRLSIHIWTLYLMETPFNTFANRADSDQAALVRAAWSGSTLFAYENMIHLILHWWTWQVISLFYVQTWMFIYIIIHSGWSLGLRMNIHEGKG